ncbi:MAG: hypothetical protein K8S00_04060, partial [Bacteroidales bacterium]|nr:hypothetical protein [Bacteroidales bacterium]
MNTIYQNAESKLIKLLFTSAFLISFSVNVNSQYCPAWGNWCDEYIDTVIFGDIFNSSPCSNYFDYTYLSTDLVIGQVYPIYVLNPNSYSSDRCDVWVDWNQDFDFDDPNEYFYLNTTNTPYNGVITPPSSALEGKTRMRIRVRYKGIIDPCGDADQNYGEVEDYSVRVIPSSNMVYSFSTCEQITDAVIQGLTDQVILRVIVVTDGGLNPLSATNFNFNTSGTTTPSDLAAAKLYYSGNNNVFSTNNPFGTAVNYPNGSFTFNDVITLVHDTNYFWLAYDISTIANIGNYVDAVFNNITINGILETPLVQDPPGAREIIGHGTLTISPDSLGVTLLACNDSAFVTLTIKNTGSDDLSWHSSLITNQSNKALHFNGSSDFVEVLSSSAPIGTSHYTIEAWIKSDYPTDGTIVGWGDYSGNYDVVNVLQFYNDWLYNFWYDKYLEIYIPNLSGAWHHIAVTYDGTLRNAYIDGVYWGSAYGNTLNVPHANNFMIGDDGYNDFFSGIMDEVRIWDRALSAEEVMSNMRLPSPINTSGMVNQWSFNEGSGTTTIDQSTNGDIGTIIGASWTADNPFSIFISSDTNSGILSAGDSVVINLKFSARDLISGIYYDSILIVSNDPLNPLVYIPCSLYIDGTPSISIPDTCIDFPPMMTGASATNKLWIYNTACDTLFIDTLFTNTTNFSFNVTSFAIPPVDSNNVEITCTPSILGIFYDTLFIINNDKDTNICLSGIGTEAPVIGTLPSQLNVIFTQCDDSTSRDIKIFNQGLYDLYINIIDPGDPSVIPLIDTLAPGDTAQTTVFFNTMNWAAGTYNSFFYIFSNDPVNPA